MSGTDMNRRARRAWAALFLLATWSLGGVWGVSHLLVHADDTHHADLHEDHQAGNEVAATGGGHGHVHPDESSALTAAKPPCKPGAALISASLTQSAQVPLRSPRVDWDVSARASPGASGPSGPRGPPLS